jgi:exodeoxyribonuclease VII large subunit
MGAHMYFTLKDAGSQIRAVLFRGAQQHLRVTPADGMEVIVHGRISVYEPRGEYQVICDRVEPKGLGALQAALERLKARLDAEGLFAIDRKRRIPPFPERIALVTSPTGAAVKDFLRAATRRFPGVHVLICPVRVQGDTAAGEVAAAIEWVNRHDAAEVIAIVRGGGSLEDLWPFNEEPLVRAIAGSAIPVVTGVGHETDVTLADFAADQRALTPTDAARIVVPDADEIRRQLEGLADGMTGQLDRIVADGRLALERLAGRLDRSRDIVNDARQLIEDRAAALSAALRAIVHDRRAAIGDVLRRAAENHPRQRVALMRARAEDLSHRLDVATRSSLKEKRRGLADTARLLNGLSPLTVLDRGYGLVFTAADELVRDAALLDVGDLVRIRLSRGTADAEIKKTSPGDPREVK